MVFLLDGQRTEIVPPQTPDERSFVFLLYPSSATTSPQDDSYIVRVPLMSLIVGLLVHQMLLRCIASVLLHGTRHLVPSLAQIIFQPSASPVTNMPDKSPLGYLFYMKPDHVETFLAALDLSYAAALRFDSRPGLKFLLQKVTNIDQAANLYQQAVAAWTIKLVTLFELSLNEIEKTEATVNVVKSILKGSTENVPWMKHVDEMVAKQERETKSIRGDADREKDGAREEHAQLSRYLKELQATFDKLCETYVEVVVDKDGEHSRVDQFDSESVFFLVAQPDEYQETKSQESSEFKGSRGGNRSDKPDAAKNGSLIFVAGYEKGDADSGDRESVSEDDEIEIYNPNLYDERVLEELGAGENENENETRPFRLSDLMGVEYSTDSGPESEPETDMDDSRPESRLGSTNDRIVYTDMSRESSREGFIDVKNDEKEAYHANVLAPSGMDGVDFARDYEQLFVRSSRDRLIPIFPTRTTLLSRQNSLKFAFTQTDDDCARDLPPPRSQSVMEIRRTAANCRRLHRRCPNSPMLRPRSTLGSSTKSKSTPESPKSRPDSKCSDVSQPRIAEIVSSTLSNDSDNALDDHKIAALLNAYQRSKFGLRMNPFLTVKNHEQNEHPPIPLEIELQRKKSILKDSEAHRKAWAEILSSSLEWALNLPNDKLAPLLPVLASGVQTLTGHAADPPLKLHLAVLFQRVAVLYGYSMN